ncbi:hypothetical protein Scep_014156 [Stephania cephalantha]|uniref:Uncharacterized protein n=1 Tax=Stephania cephalantha TaxID=152367 RepID=A0AAP0J217_9MAGN
MHLLRSHAIAVPGDGGAALHASEVLLAAIKSLNRCICCASLILKFIIRKFLHL